MRTQLIVDTRNTVPALVLACAGTRIGSLQHEVILVLHVSFISAD